MTVDYSGMLLYVTAFAGVMWCIDALYLRPRRLAAIVSASPGGGEAGRVAAGTPAPVPPFWIDYTAGLFPVLALMFVLRAFLLEPFMIPSGSMLPTLLIGDFIVVNKFAYGIRMPILNRKLFAVGEPKAGDVMVFRHPNHSDTDLIKRVVGVPGDRIVYRDKRLTINGRAATYEARPEYVDVDAGRTLHRYQEDLGGTRHGVLEMPGQPALTALPDNFPGREFCRFNRNGFDCTVPQGQYFLMGDNRDNSADSRYWGFVPDANIVGKAFFVWMNFRHLDHIGRIDPST